MGETRRHVLYRKDIGEVSEIILDTDGHDCFLWYVTDIERRLIGWDLFLCRHVCIDVAVELAKMPEGKIGALPHICHGLDTWKEYRQT